LHGREERERERERRQITAVECRETAWVAIDETEGIEG